MPSMTLEEIGEFLRRPLTVSFSTIRPDGSPHVTPIWFEYDNGKFYCFMNSGSIKVSNVSRNPHVALCIATHNEPYKYVIAEGVCEVTREGISERAHSISTRYQGEERGSKFAAEILDQGKSVLLLVTPTRLLSESAA